MKKFFKRLKEESPIIIVFIIIFGIMFLFSLLPNNPVALVEKIGSKVILEKDTCVIVDFKFPFSYRLSNGLTVDYRSIEIIEKDNNKK